MNRCERIEPSVIPFAVPTLSHGSISGVVPSQGEAHTMPLLSPQTSGQDPIRMVSAILIGAFSKKGRAGSTRGSTEERSWWKPVNEGKTGSEVKVAHLPDPVISPRDVQNRDQ